MSKKTSPSTHDLGFFQELWQQLRLALHLMVDRQVPLYLKALPIAAVAYLLLPFDFLPDLVPGLGQLDDLTILILGAKVFIEMAPKDVVDRYLQQFVGGAQAKGPTVLDAAPAEEQVYKTTDDPDGSIVDGIIVDDDDLPDK